MLVGPLDGLLLVAFLLTFFATTASIGIPLYCGLRRLRLISKPEDPVVGLFIVIGLFTVAIPIWVLLLTPFRGFGLLPNIVLVGAGAGASAYFYITKRRAGTAPSLPHIREWRVWIPISIIGGGIAFRLLPALGLYTYPADDATIYTIFSQNLIAGMGATFDLGWITPLTQPLQVYPYMFGYPAISAFYSLILNYHPALTVLLLTLTYSALVPLGIYSLARRLFGWRVAVASMLLAAFVIHWPIRFFSWGGHAEILGYFLSIFVMYLALPIFMSEKRSHPRTYLVPGIALASSALIHPNSVIYTLLFLSFPFAYALLKRDRFAGLGALKAIGTAAVVMLPVVTMFALNELRFNPDIIGVGSFAAYPAKFTVIVISWSGVSERWFDYFFQELPLLIFLSFALIALDVYRRRSRYLLLALASWSVLLFLVHVDSPYGLFNLQYPGWGFVNPARPMFFLVAIPIAITLGYLIVRIGGQIIRPSSWWKRPIALVVAGLVVGISVLQVGDTYDRLLTARDFSPVSKADIDAFRWIADNSNQGDIFWVNDADAGPWLNQYTGRQVFPMRMLINKPEVLEDFRLLDELMYTSPGSVAAIELLVKYSVTHVYFGGRTNLIWPLRSQPDLRLYSEYPDTYIEAYKREGVTIFQLDLQDIRSCIVEVSRPYDLTAKWITLAWHGSYLIMQGPVTFRLTVYIGQVASEESIVTTENIQIPEGEQWAYTLDEYTSEHPGDWNAFIELISAGC